MYASGGPYSSFLLVTIIRICKIVIRFYGDTKSIQKEIISEKNRTKTPVYIRGYTNILFQ